MLWFCQIFCWGFLGIFVCLRQIVLIDCIWCWIFFLRLFVNLHHICWIFFRLCSFVLWVLFFFVLVLFLVFCFQNLGFFFCVCFFSIFCRFFPWGPCLPLLYFFNSSIFSSLSFMVFFIVFILFSSFLIFFEWWCAFVFYDVEYAELVIYAYFFYYSGICWITIRY